MTLLELIKLIYEVQVIYLSVTYYFWLPAIISAGLLIAINNNDKNY